MPDPEEYLPLPFPERGLDKSLPLSQTPAVVTDVATNVRFFEALTGRGRGGSRCGLSKAVAGQINGGADPIQQLDTVAWIEGNGAALGSANYQEGDREWTQIVHAGTYVLARLPASPWAMSAAMGVDTLGNIGVSQPLVGTPIGGDGFSDPSILLNTPINLPANTYVLAYWQPGAFPWDNTTDWQNGNVFPGFGWMADNFTGTQTNDFGFPTATTPGFSVTDPATAPDMPFWDWPSGYGEARVTVTFQRALYVAIAAIYQPVIDPQDVMNFTLTLNGQVIHTGSTADPEWTEGTVGTSPAVPLHNIARMFTTDTRPSPPDFSKIFELFLTPPNYQVGNLRRKQFNLDGTNSLVLDWSGYFRPFGTSGYGSLWSPELVASKAIRFPTLSNAQWRTTTLSNGGASIRFTDGAIHSGQVTIHWSF